MRRETFLREERGLTLLEMTFAMATFALVMGATAQALITYYTAMDLQGQRGAAAQNLQSLLSDMRTLRDGSVGNFPGALLQRWPDGTAVAEATTLPDERITVRYRNLTAPGGPLETANPLEVTVTSQWRTLRGAVTQLSVSTVLTDR